MNERQRQKGMKDWLATRPESVQKLAKEFPIDTTVMMPSGVLHYLLGYTESDMLILTPIYPGKDYDAALKKQIYVCASHLREAVSSTGK